jgi:hypothetical protein
LGPPTCLRSRAKADSVSAAGTPKWTAGGWEDPPPVSNIIYSDVSGSTWVLEGDGRRKSPTISHSTVTKSRVGFTSGTNAPITIQLDVSSELGYDHAFISTLDNANAFVNSGFYTGSIISGEQSVTVTIPVPTVGHHFVDICYRKDGQLSAGSDRA